MSSLKPFNMTFTEDDLRSVKSRQSPYSEQTPTPTRNDPTLRVSTPKRSPTPTRISTPPPRILAPPRISTPPIQKVYPLRPSTIERRLHVNKILADEEREYQIRKNEKQQNENEAHLKEQLKRLEEERKSSRKLSNAKSTRLFPENEYKRFSNSRYYKWDSDEDIRKQHHHHHHSREHLSEELFHEEDHCELCRRGFEQERLERERRLAKLRLRSQSEHCRTIQRFVKEVNDDPN